MATGYNGSRELPLVLSRLPRHRDLRQGSRSSRRGIHPICFRFASVLSVSLQHSALHGYLPTGSIITSVDDKTLVTPDPSTDIWSAYLSAPRNGPANTLGWCAKASAGLSKQTSVTVNSPHLPKSRRAAQLLHYPGAPCRTSLFHCNRYRYS